MSVVKFGRKGLFAFFCAFSVLVVTGCSEDDGTPSDTTPPVISNLSHLNQEVINGNRSITFSVDVSDESPVSVSILYNDQPVTVLTNGNSYSVSLTLNDGTDNVVEIIALDQSDNTTSQSITLDYAFLTLTNGQDASVVIGQPDFVSTGFNRGGGSTAGANTLWGPKGVMVINDKLYIVDNSNNRVLGFNKLPAAADGDVNADFVIGQLSFTSNDGGVSSDQLVNTNVIASDGTNLLVGLDRQIKITQGVYSSTNTRIHRWSNAPSGQIAADSVIGQLEFEPVSEIRGCENNTFYSNVYGMYVAGGKLFISDTYNHRILVWNSVPTTNGVAADFVLGQTGFNSCAANDTNNDQVLEITAGTLNQPGPIWSDGEKLIVSDMLNYRVLIWNTLPTESGQLADVVIGQDGFDTDLPPQEVNGSSFKPSGIVSNGTQLFVSDINNGYSNGRVLVWDSMPASNLAADKVLGKSSLTSSVNATGELKLSRVEAMFIHNNKLIVSDTQNHRVLIFSN